MSIIDKNQQDINQRVVDAYILGIKKGFEDAGVLCDELKVAADNGFPEPEHEAVKSLIQKLLGQMKDGFASKAKNVDTIKAKLVEGLNARTDGKRFFSEQ